MQIYLFLFFDNHMTIDLLHLEMLYEESFLCVMCIQGLQQQTLLSPSREFVILIMEG